MAEKLLPEKDKNIDKVITTIKIDIEQLESKLDRMALENDCRLIPDTHHCNEILTIIKRIQELGDWLEGFVGAYHGTSDEEEKN